MKSLRFGIFGDIVGRLGRTALKSVLPRLKEQHQLDVLIANAENSAGGNGITRKVAAELLGAGFSVLTGGNHSFDKDDIFTYMDETEQLLRPHNLTPGLPGRGWTIREHKGISFAVVNLIGRVHMHPSENPFYEAPLLIEERLSNVPIRIVDFHAEVTSEKIAMGWHLDGQVSCVYGTHTHVQTADERILPNGTAYITDIGMCGMRDGIIGAPQEGFLERFRTGLKVKVDKKENGDAIVCGIVLEVDTRTGEALSIERFQETVEA